MKFELYNSNRGIFENMEDARERKRVKRCITCFL